MADIKLTSASSMFENLNISLPPNNEILLDDKGRPSVMVKIPKASYSDLGLPGLGTHPAWIVNGKEVPYIYVSKYQNVVVDGRAYSLPYKAPGVYVNFDQAVEYCQSKGKGWHLMSNVEWQAIALWCAKNDCMPGGNNNYNYNDYYNTTEKGAPMPIYDDNYGSGIPYTATGSGPKSWFHNNDFSGIADLNGNVYEWVGGIRTDNGEFQIIPDNNTAMQVDQSATSSEWKAILPGTTINNATLVTPGTSGTLISISGGLGVKGTDTAKSSSGTWYSRTASTCSSSLTIIPKQAYAHGLLNNGIESTRQDYTYFSTSADRLFCRGGSYYDYDYAGVFYLSGGLGRSDSDCNLGFRSAYVPL